jgi:hypothetical protein
MEFVVLGHRVREPVATLRLGLDCLCIKIRDSKRQSLWRTTQIVRGYQRMPDRGMPHRQLDMIR